MSSMRKTNRPPTARARSQAVMAASAWPTCSSPVGLGAKRVAIMGGQASANDGGAHEGRGMTPTLNGPRLAPARGAATHLIVLCHGYGADGNDLLGLAPHWQRLLPTTAFVAPNAPERCTMSTAGYQWFPLSRIDPHEIARGWKVRRPHWTLL